MPIRNLQLDLIDAILFEKQLKLNQNNFWKGWAEIHN